MGKVSFSGPAYGAKSLLWSESKTISTGGTTATVTARTLPPYEDWYITEMHARYGTAASTISSAATGLYLKSEGGSTTFPRPNGQASTVAQTIITLTKDGSTTAQSTWAAATPTAGEFEGVFVPAGSTLRLVSSGVDALAVQVQVMGYIRYIDSTRAGA